MASRIIETSISKEMATDFIGTVSAQFKFLTHDPEVKLSSIQRQMVKVMIEAHATNEEYVITYQSIFVSDHFVAVTLWYFPRDAKNRVYCTSRKTIYIGVNGGIRKMTTAIGMGKDSEMIPKFRSIAWNYAVDPKSC